MAENSSDKVVYDHTTGKAYLLDTTTMSIKECLTETVTTTTESHLEVTKRDLLKDSTGKYRTEVKAECRRLYMAGCLVPEISRRTGVPTNTLHQWVWGKPNDTTDYYTWKKERERYLHESRELNLKEYVAVEQAALSKINNFLTSKETEIQNSRELRDFAEALAKLLPQGVSGEGRQGARNSQGGPATQINISTTQVTPLSVEEARKLLADDPIRVEAKVIS